MGGSGNQDIRISGEQVVTRKGESSNCKFQIEVRLPSAAGDCGIQRVVKSSMGVFVMYNGVKAPFSNGL